MKKWMPFVLGACLISTSLQARTVRNYGLFFVSVPLVLATVGVLVAAVFKEPVATQQERADEKKSEKFLEQQAKTEATLAAAKVKVKDRRGAAKEIGRRSLVN